MEKIGNLENVPSVDEVILGVDTHLDIHVAVAVDQLGRRLGEITVPTTTRGYAKLLRWAEGFGVVACAGVEGTSSYGAGLVRHLKSAQIPVMEVERPKRRHLRRGGKSDPIDAEAAARAVLAGETAGEPKSGDGRVEMIRTLSGPSSQWRSRLQIRSAFRRVQPWPSATLEPPGHCSAIFTSSSLGLTHRLCSSCLLLLAPMRVVERVVYLSRNQQAVQEHTELPRHGHRRSFLGVLASAGGYLLP